MSDDILEHYGIKGMRWGVRKRSSTQGDSDDAQRAGAALKKAKTSGVKTLTNAELKAVNERLNLEKNYAQLTYSPSKLKVGLETVTKVLKGANTYNDVVKFANSDAGKKLGLSMADKSKKAYKAKHLIT